MASSLVFKAPTTRRTRMTTAITKAQMNINGNDLKDLGLEGKDIGDCMEYLYTECLKCPEINCRDELMALADNFIDEINKEASWGEEMA